MCVNLRTLRSAVLSRRSAIGSASAAAALTTAVAPAFADSASLTVDRAFVRIREGEVHYRRIGKIEGKRAGTEPLPLYMVHASPGSSSYYPEMLRRLGAQRACLAPDTLGAGDSPPPAVAAPDIAYYADSVIRILDALQIERADFCGAHTGAHIVTEVAIRAPDRVRRVIMDGFDLFSENEKKKYLANLPSQAPQDDGSHMMWVWKYMHRPGRTPDESVPRAVEILRNIRTYNLGYRAAFAHDGRERLPLVKVPIMFMASRTDPLSQFLDQAAALVPGAPKMLVEPGVEGKAAAIEQFLNS